MPIELTSNQGLIDVAQQLHRARGTAQQRFDARLVELTVEHVEIREASTEAETERRYARDPNNVRNSPADPGMLSRIWNARTSLGSCPGTSVFVSASAVTRPRARAAAIRAIVPPES